MRVSNNKALRLGASLSLVLILSACATASSSPSYNDEYKALDQACQNKQGILTPSGMQTGRPQTDYVCKITGGGTRIDRSNR